MRLESDPRIIIDSSRSSEEDDLRFGPELRLDEAEQAASDSLPLEGHIHGKIGNVAAILKVGQRTSDTHQPLSVPCRAQEVAVCQHRLDPAQVSHGTAFAEPGTIQHINKLSGGNPPIGCVEDWHSLESISDPGWTSPEFGSFVNHLSANSEPQMKPCRLLPCSRIKPVLGHLRLLLVLVFLSVVLRGESAWAHPPGLSAAFAHIDEDGVVELQLHFDVPAFVLGKASGEISEKDVAELLVLPPERLENQLREAAARCVIRIQTDRGELPFTMKVFPAADALLEWHRSGSPLPIMLDAEFEAKLPPGTRQIVFWFPSIIDGLVLTVERPFEKEWMEGLDANGASAPLTIQSSDKTQTVQPAQAGSISYFFGVLLTFVGMGFHHIVPEGLDHMLFVIGLVLLNPWFRPLAWQVSAFTLAHSITLGLSVFGVFQMPADVVEPLIALSILFVCLENLFTDHIKPWRVVLVFAFGLIHGLGFARAVSDLGLARQNILSALLGFNAGVELGQLTVIGVALSLLVWFRNNSYYRKAVAIPLSGIIAVVAWIWTLQRLP